MIDMNTMNPFKSFSASKMSENQRFNVSVEYTDYLGNTHRIVCKTRKSMLEAQAFLKIFKAEATKINRILAEYPVSMGKFPKKFHKEIKSDLVANGFGTIVKFILK
jgi:(p)ppGpp synthase/HD superfamily hydrolase